MRNVITDKNMAIPIISASMDRLVSLVSDAGANGVSEAGGYIFSARLTGMFPDGDTGMVAAEPSLQFEPEAHLYKSARHTY